MGGLLVVAIYRCPLAHWMQSFGVWAHIAQLVEHILGKDEVTSSSLVVGSI